METKYTFNIANPNFDSIGYITAIANIHDKHDRSAPTHYHWKILKCRMIIFSKSSILACPDKNDIKLVHILFNKVGDDYDKLNSLLMQFSLLQNGPIKKVTSEIFEMCFRYTMTAKIAPIWNTVGHNYMVNDRDFLISKGPLDGIEYHISSNEQTTVMNLKPVKINLMRSYGKFLPGEWIRVLPSLNKAIVDDYCEKLPDSGSFKSYKDLRRHWKNIHGYRLPEKEYPYYNVRFWRGDPLIYPTICVVRNFPIVTPVPKASEKDIFTKFLNCLKTQMSHFLGIPLTVQFIGNNSPQLDVYKDKYPGTQAISLCTPTQHFSTNN